VLLCALQVYRALQGEADNEEAFAIKEYMLDSEGAVATCMRMSLFFTNECVCKCDVYAYLYVSLSLSLSLSLYIYICMNTYIYMNI